MDRNVLPLMTVLNGVFEAEAAPTLLEVVLQACVHGWMEGHLAAPGHVVAGGATESMPAPPFPRDDSAELRAIVDEVMRRFADGEEPAAAACAAALGWRAGRQAGLDCPGCALENADQPIARAIRAGAGEYRFHRLDPAGPAGGD
jgi:hypothetical protein